MATLDTTRIDHLVDGATVSDLAVTLVGLGSVGMLVLQQLAMCSVRTWSLFDPDLLEPVNLVKHPGRRSELGRPKVDIAGAWLADRNPSAVVAAHEQDVMTSSLFEAAVAASDVVLCAVDDPAARSFVNDTAVALRRACVTGSVMRTGLGGQVYVYAPGETGCFCCLQMAADRNRMNLEDALDLTDEEQRQRYGIGEANFATSGLAIDVALLASFQAHMAWSVLVGGRSRYIPKLDFNWLTVGIRPEPGVFASHYQTSRVLVRPQKDCYLQCAHSGR